MFFPILGSLLVVLDFSPPSPGVSAEVLALCLVVHQPKETPSLLQRRGVLGETPLHQLVLFRHFDLAKIIAARYPELILDVYLEPLYEGETCLHIAIVMRDLSMVRFLLDTCKQHGTLAKLLASRVNGSFFQKGKHCYYGQTPLDFAVSTDQVDLVREMVWKYSANPMLQVPCEERRLIHSIAHSRVYVVGSVFRLLCSLSFRCSMVSPHRKFHVWTFNDCCFDLKYCAVYKDSQGSNLLHLSVWHRLPAMYDAVFDIWKEFVEQNTAMRNTRCFRCGSSDNPETDVDVDGLTPLSLAAKRGLHDMFSHILKKSCETQWTFGLADEGTVFHRSLEHSVRFSVQVLTARARLFNVGPRCGLELVPKQHRPRSPVRSMILLLRQVLTAQHGWRQT